MYSQGGIIYRYFVSRSIKEYTRKSCGFKYVNCGWTIEFMNKIHSSAESVVRLNVGARC